MLNRLTKNPLKKGPSESEQEGEQSETASGENRAKLEKNLEGGDAEEMMAETQFEGNAKIMTPDSNVSEQQKLEEAALQLDSMSIMAASKTTMRRGREKWANTTQSLASCIACLVGLGNVLRFPYNVYKFGGGAFLFAYWSIFFTVGYPTMFLELALGQFSSLGPVGMYRNIVPALEGLGICAIIVLVGTEFYYNAMFSILLFYSFASFKMDWAHCNSDWNTNACFAYEDYHACVNNTPNERWYLKGLCYEESNFTEFYRYLDECIKDPSIYKNSRQAIPNICIVRFKFCFLHDWTPAKWLGFTLPKSEDPFMKRECRKYVPTDAGESEDEYYDKPTRLLLMLDAGDDNAAKLLKKANRSIGELIGDYCQRWEQGKASGCEYGDAPDGRTGVIPCARTILRPRDLFSSEEYFNHHIRSPSADITNLKGFHYGAPLFLILSVVIIGLCVLRGAKWMGRVTYVSVVVPVVNMLTFTIYGTTLPGFSSGVEWYFNTDWCKLKDPDLWLSAASQVFFSMSIGIGLLLHLAGYNNFNQDLVRDSLIIAFFDGIFTFIAGFGIFGVVGYMAEVTHREVAEILQDSSTLELAVVSMGQCIATMPANLFWGVLFFSTLSLMAVDNCFLMVETVISFFNDTYPVLGLYRKEIVAIACAILFAFSLPFVSKGGRVLTDLLDSSLYNWIVPFIAAMELIEVVYIYGVDNIVKDIDLMFKKPGFTGCFGAAVWGNKAFRSYMLFMWAGPAPLGILIMMLSTIIVKYGVHADQNDLSMESTTGVVTLLCALCSPIFIAAMVFYNMYKGRTFKELLVPKEEWGPALNEHRLMDERFRPIETRLKSFQSITAYKWLLVFVTVLILILIMVTGLALLEEKQHKHLSK